MHAFIRYLCLLILCLSSTAAFAGGGCTFGDACSGASSVTCGTIYNMSNSSCGIASECCGCWSSCSGSCNACSSPPEHHDDCNTTVMGISCFIEGSFCGSPENSQWGRICAATSGTYTFNFSNISCSGGGASLQAGVYDQGITCATTDQSAMQFCDGAMSSNTSFNLSLTAGQCYYIVFDGNAGAVCTWTFSVTCPILPVVLATFGAEHTGGQTIRLHWETTYERDSKEFAVVRYYDDLLRESGKTWDEEMNEREVRELPLVPSRGQGEEGASYVLDDRDVDRPGQYTYRLYQHDLDGTNYFLGQSVVLVGAPETNAITNAYFSSIGEAFVFDFSVSERLPVLASLHDITGKQVASEFMGAMEPGYHSGRLSTAQLSPGIYLLDLKIGNKAFRKKLLLQ